MNYIDLIHVYLQGEADQQQKKSLSDWTSASEENYQTFLRVKNVWEAEHPAFAENDVESMMDRERHHILDRRRFSPRAFYRCWSRASAVLLVPVCIVLALVLSDGSKKNEVLQQSVSCAYGAVSNFMLPDGSVVYLNSGSTLSFPSVFDDGDRRVNLRGEAYFEVLSDKEHPFTVQTDCMDITATGTKFNVEAYPGFSSRVTLVNGVLNIDKGISSYPLAQGYQLECTPDGSVSSYRTDTFKWTSWKDGIIAFRGDRLSYVFERLSLIYNAKIIIEDPRISSLQIRATFTDERLDEIMSLLEKCAPIRCERRKSQFADEKGTEYHLYMTN